MKTLERAYFDFMLGTKIISPGTCFQAGWNARVPPGSLVIKTTTLEERSYPEDASHENGSYYNECIRCLRTFIGHKRRIICRSCNE